MFKDGGIIMYITQRGEKGLTFKTFYKVISFMLCGLVHTPLLRYNPPAIGRAAVHIPSDYTGRRGINKIPPVNDFSIKRTYTSITFLLDVFKLSIYVFCLYIQRRALR